MAATEEPELWTHFPIVCQRWTASQHCKQNDRCCVHLHWVNWLLTVKHSLSATCWQNTITPGCPLRAWPKTSHWDVGFASAISFSAVDTGSHNVLSVQKNSWNLWQESLLGITAKFSDSFYLRGAKLPVLSRNHWRNDTVAVSCLCEPKRHFLCPVHLVSGTQALFFPACLSLKIWFVFFFFLVEFSDEFYKFEFIYMVYHTVYISYLLVWSLLPQCCQQKKLGQKFFYCWEHRIMQKSQ